MTTCFFQLNSENNNLSKPWDNLRCSGILLHRAASSSGETTGRDRYCSGSDSAGWRNPAAKLSDFSEKVVSSTFGERKRIDRPIRMEGNRALGDCVEAEVLWFWVEWLRWSWPPRLERSLRSLRARTAGCWCWWCPPTSFQGSCVLADWSRCRRCDRFLVGPRKIRIEKLF